MDTTWYYLEAGERRGPLDMGGLLTILLATPDPRIIKVWREGMGDWQNAGAVPEISAKLPPPGPSLQARVKHAPSISFSEANLVAHLYRRLIVLVGLQLLLGLLVRIPDEQHPSDAAILVALVAFVGILVLFVALLLTSYKLVKGLRSRSPALTSIGMCIPLLNLFVLRGISKEAQAWCKKYGIDVGFFGPTKDSLERLRRGDV